MAFDQFNNILTVAAALSMAGWVARTPEHHLPAAENQFDDDYNEYNDYFGQQQQSWQNDNQDLLAPLLQAMPVSYDIDDHFHDSKFISDTFTPASELHDLVSWEEAYRRGDLSFGSDTRYAYPLLTYEGNNEYLFSELQNTHDYHIPYSPNNNINVPAELPSYYDDGYGSGDTNIDSPLSSDVSSLLSLNLDDVSASSSPYSPNSPSSLSLFDLCDSIGVEDINNGFNMDRSSVRNNDINAEDPPGAVGYTTSDADFDIEKLFSDDLYDLCDVFPRTKDEPPETVSSRVGDLDYASPLIDPNFDEYLGRFIAPDQQNTLDASFDDPFRMQFTDQTYQPIPDSKFGSEVLNNFDSLSYGETLEGDFATYEKNVDSEDGNKEEVELPAVHGASQTSYAGPSAENIYSPKSTVHLPDHDYARAFDEEGEGVEPVAQNAVDVLASNFEKFHKTAVKEEEVEHSSVQHSTPLLARTYAPPSRRTPTTITTKRNKRNSLVFAEVPYTADELVSMDVDKFNHLISKLDHIKQLVLKDLRKKGKNKYAARSCRKRKLDVIDNLDCNVDVLDKQRDMLLKEQQLLIDETRQIHEKTVWLNNYILERLFDENGNSYADSDYTLEYTTDGNVYLVPYVAKNDGKRVQDV